MHVRKEPAIDGLGTCGGCEGQQARQCQERLDCHGRAPWKVVAIASKATIHPGSRLGIPVFLLVPGITNRYCSPSFETATEPVIGRAFARPVGGLLRMRSNLLKHSNLMLRSERRERLEAWAASDSPISHSQCWRTLSTFNLPSAPQVQPASIETVA